MLSASAGVKGNVLIPDLYDNEGKPIEWKENGRVKIIKGGKTATTVNVTTRTIDGETHYFKKQKDNPDAEWQEISKEEYDELK